MKVAIINIGISNVFSVEQTIKNIGFQAFIANNPSQLNDVDKIILPGVGSFKKAMENLNSLNWINILKKKIILEKKPILGICLGMQLLAKSSDEISYTKGLSFIDGEITRIDNLGCKKNLPHIGWNDVKIKKTPLTNNIDQNSDFYFVHSYAYKKLPNNIIIGTTEYDIEIISIINYKNIYGVQFHPEKSSNSGKILLKNFLEI